MLFFLQYRFNRKKEGFSIYLVSLGFLFFSSFETKRRAIRYGRIGRKGKGMDIRSIGQFSNWIPAKFLFLLFSNFRIV